MAQKVWFDVYQIKRMYYILSMIFQFFGCAASD